MFDYTELHMFNGQLRLWAGNKSADDKETRQGALQTLLAVNAATPPEVIPAPTTLKMQDPVVERLKMTSVWEYPQYIYI